MDIKQIPIDENVLLALDVYTASDDVKKLISEQNRTLFGEDFQRTQPQSLAALSLLVIAANYKGRPIDIPLTPIQLKIFYNALDPKLPIEKCIHINEDYYWKRVYSILCNNAIILKQKSLQANINWKREAINMKYVDLIQNTPPEVWVLEDIDKITALAAPYITELHISKFTQMREESFWIKSVFDSPEASEDFTEMEGLEEEEEESELEDDVEKEYPAEVCHHVSLIVLRGLNQLHTLSVQYLPHELGINYHTRFFNFSYLDIQNLANGISQLKSLRVLKFSRSRWDCTKLSIIFEVIKFLPIEFVEFSFCQLEDECGENIYEYLISVTNLTGFNLSGNHFRSCAIDFLSSALHKTEAKLTFMGLSNNPITDDSMCTLVDGLLACEELLHVTLNGIHLTERGSICVAKLIKEHPKLEQIELIAVPMYPYYLIDALQANTTIQSCPCQGSGLTLDQEYKVALLIKRNRHVHANPFIGDPTKTEEEINEYVCRTKNHLLIREREVISKRRECLEKLAERDKEEQEALNEAFYMRMSEGDPQRLAKLKPKILGEDELKNRITLFGQTNINFFEKKGALDRSLTDCQ